MLKYFQDGTVESALTEKINSMVTHNRYKREWRERFMTYEQDMAVREKYWYKEGAADQKAEDEKIIQEKDLELQEQAAEIARILEENARMKAQLAEKS